MSESPTKKGPYRLHQEYLITGIVCLVSFSAMTIGVTAAAYWNIDGSFPHPKRSALFHGVFWSAWTILSVWLIVAYYRVRLFLADGSIAEQGVLSKKTINLDEITHIRWRRHPDRGSIVIRAGRKKLTLHLRVYTTEEQREVIAFVRGACKPDIQEGWTRFEESRSPPAKTAALWSRGGTMIIALVLLASSGILIYCWSRELGTGYLIVGILAAVLAFWHLWRLRTLPKKTLNRSTG